MLSAEDFPLQRARKAGKVSNGRDNVPLPIKDPLSYHSFYLPPFIKNFLHSFIPHKLSRN